MWLSDFYFGWTLVSCFSKVARWPSSLFLFDCSSRGAPSGSGPKSNCKSGIQDQFSAWCSCRLPDRYSCRWLSVIRPGWVVFRIWASGPMSMHSWTTFGKSCRMCRCTLTSTPRWLVSPVPLIPRDYTYFVSIREEAHGCYVIDIVFNKPFVVQSELNTDIYKLNDITMIIREDSKIPLFKPTKIKRPFVIIEN